ncbi:MAG: two-component system OmpR family alkaline phosphatase synthesis response regulator PhoP [Elusimicrobia bacterium]|nr:MAG: two-component system OmpR family alkaline phosphatase synthesis response regulator PhoP [Elusimicrobiota bacterium]KAF0155114.1 MAG: two-component system OmpR family alkaline phosphatase synthesis response regulator PhoP [Elusimicrobiota bacterium]
MNESTNGTYRILAVDDDCVVLNTINAALTRFGMLVTTAENLAEAKQKVTSEPFDLVIMDRILPDGDGVQMCSFLKEKPVLKTIPVLMLTGKAETDDKVLGLQLGADDYLTKPFALAELKARIDALLRRTAQLNTARQIRKSFWRY